MSLYDPEATSLVHHVNQGLRAHKLFHKDQNYIVRDGQVVLIDEFTGRMSDWPPACPKGPCIRRSEDEGRRGHPAGKT